MLSRISRSFRSIRRNLVLAGSVITLAMLTAQPAMAVAPDASGARTARSLFAPTYETFQLAVNAAQAAHAPGYILADPGTFSENVTVNGLKNVNIYGGPSTISGNLTVTNTQNVGFFSLTVLGANGLSVSGAKGSLYFESNTAFLKIKSSTLKNTTGSGLKVILHIGQIALEKVTASNSSADGAYLDNRAGSDGVSVLGSKFEKNQTFGLKILSDAAVYLAGISANSNGSDGVNVDNTTGATSVQIDKNGSQKNKFDKNGGDGLEIRSKGHIEMVAISAGKNGDFGALLVNDTGPGNVLIGDGSVANKFDGNGQAGLFVQTAAGVGMRWVSASSNLDWGMTVLASSDIMAYDMTVNKNANNGAILLNYTGSGSVYVQTDKLKMNHFDQNGGVSGLSVLSSGNVALIDISAVKNVDRGVNVDTTLQVLVDVKQSKLNHFDNNGKEGLVVEANGTQVVIKHSTATKNGLSGIFDGFHVDTSVGNGAAMFACTTSSKNTGDGIEALLGSGQLYLSDVVSTSNGGININSSDLFPTFGTCP